MTKQEFERLSRLIVTTKQFELVDYSYIRMVLDSDDEEDEITKVIKK